MSLLRPAGETPLTPPTAEGRDLGATSMPAMVFRHGALFVAVVVGIPFAVSSPEHRTFWVLLGALLFVLLPFAGAMGWFYRQIRRLQQEQDRVAKFGA